MVQATPTDLEKNFLDEEGLNYFWGKIDNAKVDKVTGKGLSTNDYTTTEKNKLSGIASGAEVNQNAFSNVSDGTNTIAASGKTDTFTIAPAGGTNGTSVTADASTKTVKISSARYTLGYTSSGTGGILKLNAGIGGVESPVSTINLVGFISNAERTLLSGLGTYSSTEVAVGTWSGGATIYRKTIDTTKANLATVINAIGINILVDMHLMIESKYAATLPIPSYFTETGYQTMMHQNKTTRAFAFNFGNYYDDTSKVYGWVEYTKSGS